MLVTIQSAQIPFWKHANAAAKAFSLFIYSRHTKLKYTSSLPAHIEIPSRQKQTRNLISPHHSNIPKAVPRFRETQL